MENNHKDLSQRLAVRNDMIVSAGIIPVYLAAEPEYLLLRAYRYWDFPKGVVEKAENPLDAAIRELREEAGIEKVQFAWGRDFFETEPYSRHKVARYFIGQTDSKNVSLTKFATAARPEHLEFRWLTFRDARRLLVPRVQRALEWAHNRMHNQGPITRGLLNRED